MTPPSGNSSNPLGDVWLACDPNSVVTVGLKQTLEERARVRVKPGGPTGEPSLVILCLGDAEAATEKVKLLKEKNPQATILVFGSGLDLPLAKAALRAGARGYIHAGMRPQQIVRAVEVAAKGEIVAPRKLLVEYLLVQEGSADLDALSARQREILEFVVEGLSNAEIGKRLYLSESTIKQHLRAAYKVLGVSNRTEAARVMRAGG